MRSAFDTLYAMTHPWSYCLVVAVLTPDGSQHVEWNVIHGFRPRRGRSRCWIDFPRTALNQKYRPKLISPKSGYICVRSLSVMKAPASSPRALLSAAL